MDIKARSVLAVAGAIYTNKRGEKANMSFVSFIQEKARDAGWSQVTVLSETLVVLPFVSDEGTQKVFIRPCGKFDGKTVLEFSSSGFPLPADEGVRLMLLEWYMERNGNLLLGHWGIEGSPDDKKCSVMVTQIAETMDPPEFLAAVRAVLREHENFQATLRKVSQRNDVDF